MTEIRAKVVEFDLTKHPNADLLSIATTRGTEWTCVVKTSDFENINKAVYFPLDALLKTTRPEFAFLDKTGKGKPARIKTCKLRGVISQGLLLPAPENAQVGDDLTEFYEVERYEPEVHVNLAGGMVRSPVNFVKYTSIENYKNYPRVLKEGEQVRISTKIHGSNFRAAYIFDNKFDENNNKILEFYVGSHNVAKDPDDANLFSKMARDLNLKDKLKSVVERFNVQQQFILFGEMYGSGVQHLWYDCQLNEQKLRLFDILIDHKYQPWETIQEVAVELGIETVPLLYRGPYSKEKAIELRDSPETLGGEIREGVVVTAEPERFEHMGRVILKFISDDYLLDQGKKGSTDGH